MRIAYLTTDAVNEDRALEMAQRHGITLCPLAPGDGPPDGSFDAVLCDWDYWPAREEVLEELLAGPAARPVALHSYNVGPDQAAALRRRGVAVHRHLRAAVLGSLRQAVLAARVAAACGLRRGDVPAAGGVNGAA
jgi:hypothetical protein